MDNELAQFNREIDEFTKKELPKNIVALQKKVVLEALRRLVMRTPVDTGRARGNWQVTIDNPTDSQLDQTDKDGNETIKKGLAAISNLPAYRVVWISNNVDYIEFLEDGSSEQAPNGMLAITIEELRTMFRKAS